MTGAIRDGLLLAWEGPYAREFLSVREVADRLAHRSGRDLTRAAIEAARRLVNAGIEDGILEPDLDAVPMTVRPRQPEEARVMEERKARSTGTTVQLLDNRTGLVDSSDPKAEPWYLLCVEHGGVLSHTVRRTIRTFISCPEEWCPGCRGGSADE